MPQIAGTFQGFYGPRAALVQYLASNQFPDEGLQFLRSCSAGIYAWVRPSPSDGTFHIWFEVLTLNEESKISVDLVLWPTGNDWSAVSSVKSMRDLMTNLLRLHLLTECCLTRTGTYGSSVELWSAC